MVKNKLQIIGAFCLAAILLFYPKQNVFAQLQASSVASQDQQRVIDTDGDGLSDYQEINIYHTDPKNPDTDGDGYKDGDEVRFGFDPNKIGGDKLDKKIVVALADQSLSYFLGDYLIGSFKISSGLPRTPTPPGEYLIIKKIPSIDYKGANYDYKNTRWNMKFKQGSPLSYYIHGAYWHHNFGQPMSHGCINVSYENMEPLYNWTDIGTKVIIK